MIQSSAIAQAAEFTLVPVVAGEDRLSEANGFVETARYAGRQPFGRLPEPDEDLADRDEEGGS